MVKFLNSFRTTCVVFHVLLFLFCCIGNLSAQQDPQYTQYMFNPLVLNPAYAGSREVISIAMVGRNQWAGMEGAPQTQTLSVNSPLQNKKIGLGLHLTADKIGPYQTTGTLASFAYRIPAGKGKLSFGLRTGIYNYKFNWSALEYKNKADYVNSYGKTNKIVPTVDFGMYYYTHLYYWGICVSHLNNPRMTPKLPGNDTINPKSNLRPDLMATAGRVFVIDDQLSFKPSILVHNSGRSSSFVDLNACLLIKEKLWLGLGLRSTRSLMILFEYNFASGFRLGYSFETMHKRLQTASAGTHEVILGWDLIRFKQKTLSLRYF
jgi:type IX secretion system PorP/SprF family membrane protein